MPEFAIDKRIEPDANWICTLQRIRSSVTHDGSSSLDTFLYQFEASRGGFLEDASDCTLPLTMQAVATIIYDQECSGAPTEDVGNQELEELAEAMDFPPLLDHWVTEFLEHILLIDYGIGSDPLKLRYPLLGFLHGTVRRFFRRLCAFMAKFAAFCRSGKLPSKATWKIWALGWNTTIPSLMPPTLPSWAIITIHAGEM